MIQPPRCSCTVLGILAFLAGRFRAGEPTLCRNVHDLGRQTAGAPRRREGLFFFSDGDAMTTAADRKPRTTDTTALTMTAAFEGIEGAYSHVVLEAYAGRRGVHVRPAGLRDVPGGRPRGPRRPRRRRPAADRQRDRRHDPRRLRRAGRVRARPARRDHAAARASAGRSARARRSRACARSSRTRSSSPSAGGSSRPCPTSSAFRSATRRSRPATSRPPSDPSHAAICSQEAAERYGLVELAGSIADHPDNTTRFLLFRAPVAERPRPRLRTGRRPAPTARPR